MQQKFADMHTDDMLYLGHEPSIDWHYTDLANRAYADAERTSSWKKRVQSPHTLVNSRTTGFSRTPTSSA